MLIIIKRIVNQWVTGLIEQAGVGVAPRQLGEGEWELFYTPLIKGLGIVFLLLFAGGTIGFAVVANPEFTAVGILAFFSLICLFMVLETFTARVRFDQNELHVQSFWQKAKTRQWADLQSYEVNGLTQFIQFQFAGQSSASVYEWMSGTKTMVAYADQLLGAGNRCG